MRAFRIAYDGRPYHGFQRQPDVPTVEGTLLRALADHGLLDPDDTDGTFPTPPGYAAAGRTDAGVSAAAQTVAFDAPDWLTPRALNGQLPGSVRAWAAADVPPGFHATHHATRRTYRYYLYAPAEGGEESSASDPHLAAPAASAAPAVDDERVRAACDRLSGSHDFHNLTPDESGTERDLAATATREDDLLVIEVSAGGFPRELVRRLVTLVRAVGTGDAPLSKVDRVLGPDPLTGPEGVGAAPATPLVLWDVCYESTEEGLDEPVRFAVDEEAAASARVAFDEAFVEARRVAAATEAIRDRMWSGER